MEKRIVAEYLAVYFIFVLLIVGLVFLRYGSLTGFAVYEGGAEPHLTSAIHSGINRTEVFSLDNIYYIADMKDASKRFYLNFSENLINETILKVYAKEDKGITTGIYAQSDSSGSNPLGTFTVTSITGSWYNITLNINAPTNSIWLGEGTGSGTDPRDEFDYIYAVNPVDDITPPSLQILFPTEGATYDYNESINLNYTVLDENLQSCWYHIDSGSNISLTCGQNTTFDTSEGLHTIYMYANDSLANQNSDSVSFTIDLNSAPLITLIKPSEGETYGYNTSIALNFSVSDIDDNIDKCWYYVDTGINITLTNCQNTSFDVSGGSHIIYIYVNDTAGELASDSVGFTVNLGAPSISLNLPLDNSYLNSNDIIFIYTPSDNDLQACELWGDFDGVFSLNQTDLNPTNNAENTFSLILSDREYVWNVKCNDTQGYEAFEGNKSFTIDTIAPVISISEPTGTKSSRTITAVWAVSDLNLQSCLYNVYRGVNAEIVNTSVNCYLNTINFDVTLDADFTFNFYANDSSGSSNSDSLNFSVSTSIPPVTPPPSGGGGGSSGGASIAPKGNLDLSGPGDVVANPGESKTLSVKAKNLGPVFLNKCKISGNYISSNDITSLAVGQEEEFVFVLNVPDDFEGEEVIDLAIECLEVQKKISFSLSSFKNLIEIELVSSNQNNNKFNFAYLVREKAERQHDINARYELLNTEDIRVSEGEDSFSLGIGEELTKDGSINLPDVAGEYTFIINLESDGFSVSLEEPVLIGSSAGLLGRAILIAGGSKTLGIALFVLVLAFAVVYVVRRIMRRHLKEDKTGYVKVKLNK